MTVKKLTNGRPKPKLHGIITKSDSFKSAVDLLSKGQEVSIKLPENFLKNRGIKPQNAVNSFKRSLARYVDNHLEGKFWVYVIDGVIYAARVRK